MLPQMISTGLGARVRCNLKGTKPFPGILICAALWAAGRVVNVMNALLSSLFSVCELCFVAISGFKRASSVRVQLIVSTCCQSRRRKEEYLLAEKELDNGITKFMMRTLFILEIQSRDILS